MSKNGSRGWDTQVACPRWVQTKLTPKDAGLPNHITEDEMYKLPEAHGETYEECSGQVRVHGYYDPGRTYGDPYDCYPPEGENFVEECDAYADGPAWSQAELDKFEKEAQSD